MAAPTPNPHLPPHLREVCALLAAGLLRLRSRTAEDLARDAPYKPVTWERVRYTYRPTRAVMRTPKRRPA